jgi:hypothetical protein
MLSRRKLALGIFTTIFLGAIGSGLWEYALKPICLKSTYVFLNIATLGMTSFKNALYLEIAKGLHESTSLTLLSIILSALPGILTGMLIIFYFIHYKKRESIFKIRDSNWFIPCVILYALFLFVFTFILLYRESYVNRAITHFRQVLAINEPFLTSQEKNQFISQFSQVSNATDYKLIITKLEEKAKSKNQKIPEFFVWQ